MFVFEQHKYRLSSPIVLVYDVSLIAQLREANGTSSIGFGRFLLLEPGVSRLWQDWSRQHHQVRSNEEGHTTVAVYDL